VTFKFSKVIYLVSYFIGGGCISLSEIVAHHRRGMDISLPKSTKWAPRLNTQQYRRWNLSTMGINRPSDVEQVSSLPPQQPSVISRIRPVSQDLNWELDLTTSPC